MVEGETPPPPPKIKINSPFFLGANDRPGGDFITPVRLKLDNFDTWAHARRWYYYKFCTACNKGRLGCDTVYACFTANEYDRFGGKIFAF